MNEAIRRQTKRSRRLPVSSSRQDGFITGGQNFTKTYDELPATDPIGKDEFDAIVERVLIAAFGTRLSRTR